MSLNENQTALKHKLTESCELHHLTIYQLGAGGGIRSFKLFYITQKLAM